MARLKSEVLTIRTTSEIKGLLRQAAEMEHRSAASMVEVLILEHAKKKKLIYNEAHTNRPQRKAG